VVEVNLNVELIVGGYCAVVGALVLGMILGELNKGAGK